MERFVKSSIAIVVLAVIVYFSYSLIAGWYKGNIEIAKTQERKIWQEKTENLVAKIENLEEELKQLKGQEVSEEKLAEVFGKNSPNETPSKETKPTFEEIEHQITALFAYLDEQEYVKAHKLAGGTYNQYEISVNKLSTKLPIVTGETDSLYNLFLNIAHFYRVLGKKRLLLARDILNNESEIIESVMNTFYQWYTFDEDSGKKLKGRPSPAVLYEYSGFFLNTLGGRSYLLRRDSRIRLLTTYYCVMILDRANDKGLNSNGIDIRPHIESVFNDITNQIGLLHQKKYLLQLENLKKKYKMS